VENDERISKSLIPYPPWLTGYSGESWGTIPCQFFLGGRMHVIHAELACPVHGVIKHLKRCLDSDEENLSDGLETKKKLRIPGGK